MISEIVAPEMITRPQDQTTTLNVELRLLRGKRRKENIAFHLFRFIEKRAILVENGPPSASIMPPKVSPHPPETNLRASIRYSRGQTHP